jgi:hypothetical protein
MAWVSCPQCQAKAEGGRGCLIILLIVLTFPIGLLFLLVKPTFICSKCGFKFKT